MSSVRAWTFTTGQSPDGVLAALQGQLEFAWSIRESEVDGRYVLGRRADGAKVRVLFEEGDRPTLELYAPLDADAATADVLAAEALAVLFPAMGAAAVRPTR